MFRLFGSTLGLFIAALDHCFDRIVAALEGGADEADTTDAEAVLAAMGDAYTRLIADRDLILLQATP